MFDFFTRKGGPLELLIVQPTPFCNLACTYCYLDDKSSTTRMADEVLEVALRNLADSHFSRKPFTIAWHAGEPLSLPVDYYRTAIARIRHYFPRSDHVTLSVQTNGTTITPEYAAFLVEHEFKVGLSIDGPMDIHDACRVDRRGRGSFDRTVRGAQLLAEAGSRFSTISVVSNKNAHRGAEIYDFLVDLGSNYICFNVEEYEGHNDRAPARLASPEYRAAYKLEMTRFFSDVFGAYLRRNELERVRVREFDGAVGALKYASRNKSGYTPTKTQQTQPLKLITIDTTGRFSTFCPELHGVKMADGQHFAFGSVQTDSFESALGNRELKAISTAINLGIQKCRQTCDYFSFCGGGTPSNKFFENGRFDSTETLFCLGHRQAVIDGVLSGLEALC